MNRNITALILIVVAVGIYFTITQNVIASAEQVKSVNDQYTSAIANAARLIAVRDQVLQEYNSISSDDRARLDLMIPSTVDNIRLIIDLNGVAARQGLVLKGITAAVSSSDSSTATNGTGPASTAPIAPTSASALNAPTVGNTAASLSMPELDTVTVSFGVSATYQQFVSLLQAIEANLRIMDLTHLSVTANNNGVYDFSLEFKTYWIRQTTSS